MQLPCPSYSGVPGFAAKSAHITFAVARRAAQVREELPAAVGQLPQARPQAWPSLPGGGGAGHRPPRAARQQVRSYDTT
jgi:hypothetical protein